MLYQPWRVDRLAERHVGLLCYSREQNRNTEAPRGHSAHRVNESTFQKVVPPPKWESAALLGGRFHSWGAVFKQKLVLGHFLSNVDKDPLHCSTSFNLEDSWCLEVKTWRQKKTCSVITERRRTFAKWCALNSDESRKCSLKREGRKWMLMPVHAFHFGLFWFPQRFYNWSI